MATPQATPQNNGTQPGHNLAAVEAAAKQSWLDQCAQFGEAAGQGDTSMIGWFQDMVGRAYRDEIKPDWAEEGTDAYLNARRKRAIMLGKRVGTTDKRRGVSISEARKMIRLGALAQFREKNNGGLGVFNDALKVIGDDPEIRGEASKLLLKVATEQLRRPDEPMDVDYIKQTLRPKETEDKGEGDRLYAAKQVIERVAKDFNWDPHKRSALNSINARLEQLHFKTAGQRRLEAMAKAKAEKEKKARAAAAKAKKK
jgi:hypothetical protein